MPTTPRSLAILVLAVLLLGNRLASAQPSAEDKKEAKAAFARAEAAERRKDWRTAIDEYQHAYDLAPHPNALFNIAVDFERLEEFRDAVTFYRRYLDESSDAGDLAKVEALIDKLRARPGKVTLTSRPSGASVLLDGKRAGRTPLELKLSGVHEIELSDGAATATRTVTVEFGEPQAVDVVIAARAGTLVITGNVPGAQVTIDDRVAGVVPFSGPVEAGPHRVEVTAEGWSTYQRPVDVPAEGSTQMTANLVRPLGYVAPEQPAKEPRGYLLFAGGADSTGGLEGGLYLLLFGGHRGRFDGGIGYGVTSASAGFALDLRISLMTTKIRPYLRASAILGSTSTVSGHVGVMATVGLGGRSQTSVFADVGGGYARSGSTGTDQVRVAIVPIMVGIQLAY